MLPTNKNILNIQTGLRTCIDVLGFQFIFWNIFFTAGYKYHVNHFDELNFVRSNSFFMGGNVRKAVAEGRGDAIPIFLSEIPLLFYKGIVKPDIAVIQVSQWCLFVLKGFIKEFFFRFPLQISMGIVVWVPVLIVSELAWHTQK